MDSYPKSFWWALASCGVMVLGAFGPWARVLELVNVSGLDGGDGWFVLVAALIAAGFILLRQNRGLGLWPLLVALLAAAIAAAVAIYDWTDLNSVADRTGLVHAGWGIYLATIASCSLVLACIGLHLERRPAGQQPVAPPAPSGE